MKIKQILLLIIALLVLALAVAVYNKITQAPICVYDDIFLISSDGDIDTMPGMYTFEDFGDSVVVEDAGENFATFERGVDGTYIFEGVIYALAIGDEDVSFIALGHDLRVALVNKNCE